MDQACSLGLLILLAAVWASHAVRTRAGHPAQFERVELEGSSALLSRGMLESLYAVIVPIGRAFTRVALGPNLITALSVLFAFIAGALFAAGLLGVGCVFAIAAMGSDALDGFVARASGKASSAGEVIDAGADRYVELCLFAGLAVHLRALPGGLVLALAALAGSFMVSYSTAKAESLSVVPPRGSMRRTERGFLLIVGAGLTPLTPALGLRAPWNEAPLWVALALIAVGANVSAITRFAHVVRTLRARDRPDAVQAPEAETLPVDR